MVTKMSCMVIKKYLESYAEPEVEQFSLNSPFYFDALLVLPVFDEPIENLNHFLNLSSTKSITMIWVFNCPDNACEDAQARTMQLMSHFIGVLGAQRVEALGKQNTDSEYGIFLSQARKRLSVLIVDRCSKGNEIPAKQGVGLARKLGMDLGLKLLQQQTQAEPVKWLHSCDADVCLPHDYFDIAKPERGDAVALYPFRHVAEAGYEQAMALYDVSLRYYVQQLASANSPYAFHTIGSLIVVTPTAYAQVRGVPKRSGAEDFYFLNKLAKVGRVINLDQPILRVAGRPSHRVPFGTGPAISKIKEMAEPLKEYTFYHPEIFLALKQVLAIVSDSKQSIASVDLFFEQVYDKMEDEKAKLVISTLKELKLEKQYQHLGQKKDASSFKRAFHVWFDAFVTLRFIHILRDKAYPNVTLDTLPFEVRQQFGV